MKETIDGKALVYADGAFNTPEGKTAHGLTRFTHRYELMGVIDRTYAGQDAGMVMDNRPNGILIFETLAAAMSQFSPENTPETLVMGLAPDGERLSFQAKETIREAFTRGLNVDSGLHDFLYDERLGRVTQAVFLLPIGGGGSAEVDLEAAFSYNPHVLADTTKHEKAVAAGTQYPAPNTQHLLFHITYMAVNTCHNES